MGNRKRKNITREDLLDLFAAKDWRWIERHFLDQGLQYVESDGEFLYTTQRWLAEFEALQLAKKRIRDQERLADDQSNDDHLGTPANNEPDIPDLSDYVGPMKRESVAKRLNCSVRSVVRLLKEGDPRIIKRGRADWWVRHDACSFEDA